MSVLFTPLRARGIRAAPSRDPQARKADERTYILTLLGGDTGLRIGEIIALRWTDLDVKRRLLTVARSEWQGEETSPKGGQSRVIPMTTRLAAALEAHRDPCTPVLSNNDASGIDQGTSRAEKSPA